MSRNKTILQPLITLSNQLPPKQYRLQHRTNLFQQEGYLHKFVETGTYFLENEFGNDLYQSSFTLEEIKELIREYDVLFYFEMKEITDYD